MDILFDVFFDGNAVKLARGGGEEILHHRGMDDQEGKIHQTNNPL